MIDFENGLFINAASIIAIKKYDDNKGAVFTKEKTFTVGPFSDVVWDDILSEVEECK